MNSAKLAASLVYVTVFTTLANQFRDVTVSHSKHSAPLAQLDRASGYEPEGREFESLRARHNPFKNGVFRKSLRLGGGSV
jgi:hypothetical protein